MVGVIVNTSHQLKGLYLSKDNSGSNGVAVITNFLASNLSLQFLDLGDNNLDNRNGHIFGGCAPVEHKPLANHIIMNSPKKILWGVRRSKIPFSERKGALQNKT